MVARPGAVKTGLLLISLAGSAIAAAHGLYGIVYRSLTVAGAIDVDGQSFDASRHGWVIWDLLVFEPWFLIEGLLLAGLGGAATSPSFRRRWVVACAAGIALATLTGLLGVSKSGSGAQCSATIQPRRCNSAASSSDDISRNARSQRSGVAYAYE